MEDDILKIVGKETVSIPIDFLPYMKKVAYKICHWYALYVPFRDVKGPKV